MHTACSYICAYKYALCMYKFMYCYSQELPLKLENKDTHVDDITRNKINYIICN